MVSIHLYLQFYLVVNFCDYSRVRMELQPVPIKRFFRCKLFYVGTDYRKRGAKRPEILVYFSIYGLIFRARHECWGRES